jgi:hypothetical protein
MRISVSAFEQQERRNPLLTRHFSENYDLEFALAKARRYSKTTGRLPSVAFTVPQVVWEDGFRAKQLSGGVIVLNNPAPKFPCEELRSVFCS